MQYQPLSPTSPGSETADLRPSIQVRLLLLAVLSLVGSVYPKLSFPAVFLCLVALVATPKQAGSAAIRARLLLVLSAVAATVGLLRFVLEEAIPGVLAGGKAAIEKQAVAYARTLVAAEDHARGSAYLDPDGDHVGSALGVLELSGLVPLPNGSTIREPPLSLSPDDLRDTALGGAVREAGYLVAICLPQGDSQFGIATGPRDPERAEREYRIYAWPESFGAGSPTTTYFLDADERILRLDAAPDDKPVYVGTTRPPPCDAIHREKGWKAWKGKQPRTELPFATRAQASSETKR